MKQARGLPLGVKVIIGFHLLSLVMWFFGQSVAVVAYDRAAAWGLQDPRAQVDPVIVKRPRRRRQDSGQVERADGDEREDEQPPSPGSMSPSAPLIKLASGLHRGLIAFEGNGRLPAPISAFSDP